MEAEGEEEAVNLKLNDWDGGGRYPKFTCWTGGV